MLRWGPYYPLGIVGTVPRAYDIFRAYEGMGGRTNENRSIKIGKFNTKYKIQIQKYFFKIQNCTVSLPVKWEVCENTFLSLCLAKGVVIIIIIIIIM
jgi:hypothetical protein